MMGREPWVGRAELPLSLRAQGRVGGGGKDYWPLSLTPFLWQPSVVPGIAVPSLANRGLCSLGRAPVSGDRSGMNEGSMGDTVESQARSPGSGSQEARAKGDIWVAGQNEFLFPAGMAAPE